MVQPGEDMIRLELTVDKAELERQLNQVFGKIPTPTGGAPGGGRTSFLGPEARAELSQLKQRKRAQAEVGELEALRKKPPATGLAGALEGLKASSGTGGKGLPVTAGAGMLKALGPLAALAGISLSLTGLLKLSKLAGGMAGALQGVLGAMLDSFIAPFMPLMARGISWLAEKGIPAAIKAGEKTFEWATKIWGVLDGPVKFILNAHLQKFEVMIDIFRAAFAAGKKVGAAGSRVGEFFSQDVPGFWKGLFSRIPGGDLGGRVPGPIGRPQLMMAQGGEEYSGVGGNYRRLGGSGLTLQMSFPIEVRAENSADAVRQILRQIEPDIMSIVSSRFFELQSQFSRV